MIWGSTFQIFISINQKIKLKLWFPLSTYKRCGLYLETWTLAVICQYKYLIVTFHGALILTIICIHGDLSSFLFIPFSISKLTQTNEKKKFLFEFILCPGSRNERTVEL